MITIFGDLTFAVFGVVAIIYMLYLIIRYLFFYPEKSAGGSVSYTRRSNARFAAYLTQRNARLKNHESAKIEAIPYHAYAEVE